MRTLSFQVRYTMDDTLKQYCDTGYLFCATRPLMGSKTWEGDYLAGRFFAYVEHGDEFASQNIITNKSLDARLIKHVSMDEIHAYINGKFRSNKLAEIRKSDTYVNWCLEIFYNAHNKLYQDVSFN